MFYQPINNHCVCENAQIHQGQEQIAVTIRNNENQERSVYVYGKETAMQPNDVFGYDSFTRLIDIGPSTALLPSPIVLAPGEERTVNVPVPPIDFESYRVPARDVIPGATEGTVGFPIMLSQLDLRIQYYTQWCRQIFPIRQVGPITPIPTVLRTTTTQIGQSNCHYGTWFT